MRSFLFLLSMAVIPACGTSVAQVPSVDREAALQLVIDDLSELSLNPDTVHWRRAYRHFDRHLESHLTATDRLRMEVAFGSLREDLKIAPPDVVAARIVAIQERLQPQD